MVRFQGLQHVAAVHSWHIKIKQDEIGERVLCLVLASDTPVQISQQLFAIPDAAESATGAGLFERILGDHTVIGIIVDHNQNHTVACMGVMRKLL
jgi:hypothetical protein